MQAIADTKRLVAEGVISAEQAKQIETQARERMVYLAVNSVLCFGILAATGGLISWLGTPVTVAAFGFLSLGLGFLILSYGSMMFRMFGNASALIGAGMLIGGASLELISNYEGSAGWIMIAVGAIVALASARLFVSRQISAHFVTGSILLMGLAMHLGGMVFELLQKDVSGAPMSIFYLYATASIIAAGWLTDVRLVTVFALAPFAQVLDTGTFYFHAAYVFYSPEPTLSIIQMIALIAGCNWISLHWSEHSARHARVLAVIAFIVANLCALVGSLWGDYVGETIWGPGYFRYSQGMDWEEWQAAQSAFRDSALFFSANVYSVVWAIALAALIFWAARCAQRGLFNTGLTFAGIHAYTQMFESFGDEPLAYVIGGLATIPLAWGMWRLDQWMTRQYSPAKPD